MEEKQEEREEVNIWKLINQMEPLLGKIGKTLTTLNSTIAYMEDIGLKTTAEYLKIERDKIERLFIEAIQKMVPR